MSIEGGYAMAAPPTLGGDRFYNPADFRLQKQLILQHQIMMQRNLFQQQQQQRLQLRQLPIRTVVNPESPYAEEADERNDSSDSSLVEALTVPRPVSSAPSLNMTNLDRLMESVTPFIQARFLSEINPRGCRTRELDSHPFFYLEDLWVSFIEWSVYGAGVPLLLNGRDMVEQYYVPFLSGIELYIDPSKHSSCLRSPDSQGRHVESKNLTTSSGSSSYSKGKRTTKWVLKLNPQEQNRFSMGNKLSSSSSEAASANAHKLPLFQFFEYEQPYKRRPLADKISLLASEYPELRQCRSCDLLPISWICVAWYPIYRIPIGPTLRHLDASFLTFHSLSTQPRTNPTAYTCQPQFNNKTACCTISKDNKISLPVFALASYKLKGSMATPCGSHECEQEGSLLQAADDWLKYMDVVLPDYQFFRSHYSR